MRQDRRGAKQSGLGASIPAPPIHSSRAGSTAGLQNPYTEEGDHKAGRGGRSEQKGAVCRQEERKDGRAYDRTDFDAAPKSDQRLIKGLLQIEPVFYVVPKLSRNEQSRT
jgi:hypothetical protein